MGNPAVATFAAPQQQARTALPAQIPVQYGAQQPAQYGFQPTAQVQSSAPPQQDFVYTKQS